MNLMAVENIYGVAAFILLSRLNPGAHSRGNRYGVAVFLFLIPFPLGILTVVAARIGSNTPCSIADFAPVINLGAVGDVKVTVKSGVTLTPAPPPRIKV